jgi:hypothetical protein
VKALVADIIGGLILALLTVNVLWANWGWNLLYVRTDGPLFPGVHALSIAAPVILAWVLVFRKRSVWKGALIGFGVAALHDWVWVVGEIAATGTQWELGVFYAVVELSWLGLAVWFATKEERRLMILSGVGFVVVFLLGVALNDVGTTAPYRGKAVSFYDVKNNLMEIFGWVVGPMLWLVPKP